MVEGSFPFRVMNLQTPKALSPPFVFLKRRNIPPVKRNRKNVFRSDYALKEKSCCVNFLITRILRVPIGNVSLGHSKLIYDAVINEACKFS